MTTAHDLSVAYLGPAGTFCHEAALSQSDLSSHNLVAHRAISDVFEAIDNGDSDLGVVPLENTIEGSVALTLDMLVFDSEAMIQREIDHNISLCLAAIKGTDTSAIDTVLSHPHALAQCRGYLDANVATFTTKATDSTASAAHQVATAQQKNYAAICPVEAAKANNLEILDAHIQDRDINQTRFIVIGQDIPAATGNDKTSIVCFQRANKPGSLLAILKEFAERNIDLTKLESRPTKEGLGQYCFLMDFLGHISEERIAQCLEHVRNNHADVKFLGSYAIAGDKSETTTPANTKVWKDTSQWMKDLLAKVSPS
jgi:prephenate dehydratase